jgi:GTPase Era involved in 16S rRNA processing
VADGDVVFVDTPGFDDTRMSDTDVLQMVVSDWLRSMYVF